MRWLGVLAALWAVASAAIVSQNGIYQNGFPQSEFYQFESIDGVWWIQTLNFSAISIAPQPTYTLNMTAYLGLPSFYVAAQNNLPASTELAIEAVDQTALGFFDMLSVPASQSLNMRLNSGLYKESLFILGISSGFGTPVSIAGGIQFTFPLLGQAINGWTLNCPRNGSFPEYSTTFINALIQYANGSTNTTPLYNSGGFSSHTTAQPLSSFYGKCVVPATTPSYLWLFDGQASGVNYNMTVAFSNANSHANTATVTYYGSTGNLLAFNLQLVAYTSDGLYFDQWGVQMQYDLSRSLLKMVPRYPSLPAPITLTVVQPSTNAALSAAGTTINSVVPSNFTSLQFYFNLTGAGGNWTLTSATINLNASVINVDQPNFDAPCFAFFPSFAGQAGNIVAGSNPFGTPFTVAVSPNQINGWFASQPVGQTASCNFVFSLQSITCPQQYSAACSTYYYTTNYNYTVTFFKAANPTYVGAVTGVPIITHNPFEATYADPFFGLWLPILASTVENYTCLCCQLPTNWTNSSLTAEPDFTPTIIAAPNCGAFQAGCPTVSIVSTINVTVNCTGCSNGVIPFDIEGPCYTTISGVCTAYWAIFISANISSLGSPSYLCSTNYLAWQQPSFLVEITAWSNNASGVSFQQYFSFPALDALSGFGLCENYFYAGEPLDPVHFAHEVPVGPWPYSLSFRTTGPKSNLLSEGLHNADIGQSLSGSVLGPQLQAEFPALTGPEVQQLLSQLAAERGPIVQPGQLATQVFLGLVGLAGAVGLIVLLIIGVALTSVPIQTGTIGSGVATMFGNPEGLPSGLRT